MNYSNQINYSGRQENFAVGGKSVYQQLSSDFKNSIAGVKREMERLQKEIEQAEKTKIALFQESLQYLEEGFDLKANSALLKREIEIKKNYLTGLMKIKKIKSEPNQVLSKERGEILFSKVNSCTRSNYSHSTEFSNRRKKEVDLELHQFDSHRFMTALRCL